jgi:predicted 3-demethylubiquinone-9 3-methyltransferase (glyoxalase superfamily)
MDLPVDFSDTCPMQKITPFLWFEFWRRLSDGGEEGQCGWRKDKYGLSWQVNPTILGEMLSDPDPARSKRVMEAMLKMKKIDIGRLKQAYDQR